MRPRAVIFDRDGTLASCPKRPDGQKGWDEFHAAMPLDPVVPVVRALMEALRPGIVRLVVSGRAEGDWPGDRRRRFAMQDWLHKHSVPYDHLFMRAGGDMRRDSVVKHEILHRDILPHFEPVFAVDDRPQVIEVWEAHDIPVMRVSDPEFPFPIERM